MQSKGKRLEHKKRRKSQTADRSCESVFIGDRQHVGSTVVRCRGGWLVVNLENMVCGVYDRIRIVQSNLANDDSALRKLSIGRDLGGMRGLWLIPNEVAVPADAETVWDSEIQRDKRKSG